MDRVVLYGSFRSTSHPVGMSHYLRKSKIMMKHYKKECTEVLRNKVRQHVAAIAEHNGTKIRHLNTNAIRKDDLVQDVLEQRGDAEGVVCILSTMECCLCFRAIFNKQTVYMQMAWGRSKCLYYYVYIMDDELGLCYLHISTWAPFRLQFSFNGHNRLERQILKEGISLNKARNTFVDISDFERAGELALKFNPGALHRRPNRIAKRYVAGPNKFGQGLYQSMHQIEWATDIVFKSDRVLPTLHRAIVRTAACETNCHDIYHFLGKRFSSKSAKAVATSKRTFKKGTHIKHSLRSSSVKMYDKQGIVLRIETSTGDVISFTSRHTADSQANTQTCEYKSGPLCKTICKLPKLAEIFETCNRRYLEYVSQLSDRTRERLGLGKIVESQRDHKGRSYRGVNFFLMDDMLFVLALLRGEHHLQGFRHKDVRRHLPRWNCRKTGRSLFRFRMLGLIKKVKGTTRYYLSEAGKRILPAVLQLKDRVIIGKEAST